MGCHNVHRIQLDSRVSTSHNHATLDGFYNACSYHEEKSDEKKELMNRTIAGITRAVTIAPLVALTFLALGRKLLSQLFLFRFFIPFYLFLLCDLSILLFTFHYTRHKSQLQINDKYTS